MSYRYSMGGRQVGIRIAMNVSAYGAHVSIAAPPSSEVFDATQLAQGGFGNALVH
jgi:hypothetical protein